MLVGRNQRAVAHLQPHRLTKASPPLAETNRRNSIIGPHRLESPFATAAHRSALP
jgi:hypothetical protein